MGDAHQMRKKCPRSAAVGKTLSFFKKYRSRSLGSESISKRDIQVQSVGNRSGPFRIFFAKKLVMMGSRPADDPAVEVASMIQTTLEFTLEFGGYPLLVETEARAYLLGDGAYLLNDCAELLDVAATLFSAENSPYAKVKGVHNPEDGSTTIQIQMDVDMEQSRAFEIENEIADAFAEHCHRIPPRISVAVMARAVLAR